ncbi:MAG: hypothetical protein U0163_20025 [Gemmatimonadaceae bacterium]
MTDGGSSWEAPVLLQVPLACWCPSFRKLWLDIAAVVVVALVLAIVEITELQSPTSVLRNTCRVPRLA